MDELRVAREKIVQLDEKNKREERNNIQAHERMVQLEEKCRELKQQIRNQPSKLAEQRNNSTVDVTESIHNS